MSKESAGEHNKLEMEKKVEIKKDFAVRGYSGNSVVKFSKNEEQISPEEQENWGAWNELVPRSQWDQYVVLSTGAGEYALKKSKEDQGKYGEAIKSEILLRDGIVHITQNRGLISDDEFIKVKPEERG